MLPADTKCFTNDSSTQDSNIGDKIMTSFDLFVIMYGLVNLGPIFIVGILAGAVVSGIFMIATSTPHGKLSAFCSVLVIAIGIIFVKYEPEAYQWLQNLMKAHAWLTYVTLGVYTTVLMIAIMGVINLMKPRG